jgi:flagellar basal body-associated protein FliL
MSLTGFFVIIAVLFVLLVVGGLLFVIFSSIGTGTRPATRPATKPNEAKE